ncbi:MAG: hypothetical protein NUV98_04800 [Candidatus Roizmanbacteria bacterium]|nr:hypothetical protein [Candidatus Roizmanbacteria bacterium]
MQSNKEQQPILQGLRSLDSLEPETFHTLSYRDQLVVVNNTTVQADSSRRTPRPLTLADIDDEELRILQFLINTNEVVGPLASTGYEFPSAWQNYVPDDDEKVWDAMEFAEKHDLWTKYTGSVYYDSHRMGEIVHALRLILEGELPGNDMSLTFSPAKAIPAYYDGLQMVGQRNAGEHLFVGALSPASVSGIWGVRNYLLPQNSGVRIVDIDGVLNNEGAKHYGIDFSYENGLETRLPTESQEIVFTNSVTPWFSNYHPESLTMRRSFFEESRRILKPDGALVMIEHPLFDMDSEEPFDPLIAEDYARMQEELSDVGFQNITISPARVFDSQRAADTFLKTGCIDEGQTRSDDLTATNVPPALIVAY